jgi:hypothetical protein
MFTFARARKHKHTLIFVRVLNSIRQNLSLFCSVHVPHVRNTKNDEAPFRLQNLSRLTDVSRQKVCELPRFAYWNLNFFFGGGVFRVFSCIVVITTMGVIVVVINLYLYLISAFTV